MNLRRYAPLILNFTESFSATFSFRLSFNKCRCSCFRCFVSALACYRNFNRERTSNNAIKNAKILFYWILCSKLPKPCRVVRVILFAFPLWQSVIFSLDSVLSRNSLVQVFLPLGLCLSLGTFVKWKATFSVVTINSCSWAPWLSEKAAIQTYDDAHGAGTRDKSCIKIILLMTKKLHIHQHWQRMSSLLTRKRMQHWA